ncbi:hypothetical protein BC832DRAFT_563376 [Gaertneriomyces semiglobifer]|nr:hypothetical protein BC832DRAFT_563376 [Gaertneriomyces semiglobifer]
MDPFSLSSSHDGSSHQYQQQQHSSNRVNNFKQKFIEKASGATAKAAEWRQKAAEKSTVLSAKAKNAVSDWDAKRHAPTNSTTSGSSKHSGNSNNNTSQNDTTILFGVDIAESTFKSHLPSNVSYDVSLYDSDTVYNVPAVCFRCVEYLDQTALDTVGIYRLSGSTTEIASLRRLFANVLSDAPPLNTLNPPPDPNAVASLFKAFLRELPTSLFPPLPSFPDSEVDAASLSEHLREYTKDEHTSLLRLLFRHLQRVADLEENKMNAENLGIVFAPTLGVKAAVIKTCVESWKDAWPDPPSTSQHWELRQSPEKEEAAFIPPAACASVGSSSTTSTSTSTSAPRLNTTATPPIPPRSSVPPGSLSYSDSSLQPQAGSQPPPPPKPARPRPKSSDASPSTANSASLPATLQLLNLMDEDIPPTHSRSAGSGSGIMPPALPYSSFNRPAKPIHNIRTSGAVSMAASDLGLEDLHVMSPVDFTGSIYPSLPRDTSANGHSSATMHTQGTRQNDMYGFSGMGMYPSTHVNTSGDGGLMSGSGMGNGNMHNPFASMGAPPGVPSKEGNPPFLGTRGGYAHQHQQLQSQQQQQQVYQQQPTQRYHAQNVAQPLQDAPRHHVPPGYTYWSTPPPPNAASAATGTSVSASSLASPYNPFDTRPPQNQQQQQQQQVRHAPSGGSGKHRESGGSGSSGSRKPQPPERVDSFPNRI